MQRKRYVVISPARDEQDFLEITAASVIAQTILPLRWIIVDDGSKDRTPEILKSYSQRYDWIRIVTLPRREDRNPGPAGVYAFNAGLSELKDVEFEFIVKLDADLRLPEDYFENLLNEFQQDAKLGIASGIYLEDDGKRWMPIHMPWYHSAGASKCMRKECYSDFGGYSPTFGWDTIDEIRAQMKGWKTRHIPELTFWHLRHEGSSIGRLNTFRKNGETYYLVGGSFFFLLFKCLRQLTLRPYLIASLSTLLGFLRHWLVRTPRLVTDAEAKHYRQMLNARLTALFSSSHPSKFQETEHL